MARQRDARGSGDGWSLETYTAEDGSEPFASFLDDLDDFTFAALDAALRLVLARRGIDLARTEWLKPLGEGLHEFRVRHDAEEIQRMFGGEDADAATNAISPPVRVLLRVFVHFHGDRVVLLLAGYDKGDDPSARRQAREIARARKLLTAWRAEQLRRKKAARRQGS
jgi:putative component of toxin-antitoxin plasmid stabilization module